MFQILRHKTEQDTYGRLAPEFVYKSDIPELFPLSLTIDGLIAHFWRDKYYDHHIDDFELIPVHLNILQ